MISQQVEHFDIEVSYSVKEMLTKAAEVDGCSLTALIVQAAIDKAREILQNHQEMVLSPSEWDGFMATLDNPPPPNEALKAALKDYKAAALS
jgi:uncharacterized protein (DUF1778 family)